MRQRVFKEGKARKRVSKRSQSFNLTRKSPGAWYRWWYQVVSSFIFWFCRGWQQLPPWLGLHRINVYAPKKIGCCWTIREI